MLGWLRAKWIGTPGAADAHSARSASTPNETLSAPPSEEVSAPTGALQLYRAGHTEEAERAARALLEVDPSDVQGLLVQGLLALDRSRTLDALRTLEGAAEVAPTQADLQIALGRALAAAGRRPAAKSAFLRALELEPRSGEPLLQLGLLALASGRADEALQQFSAAVHSEPGLAEAHFQLGNLLRERGRLDDAVRHYRRAVAAGPDHALALANLGSLLKNQGRADEAAQCLEQALKLKPSLTPASFNLAMLRIDQRRWHDATALLRNYLAAEPKQADAQYWLGNASMGDGDVAAARKAYQAAMRLNGNYVQARWGHAMAQLPAVALTDAEQGVATQAFDSEVTKLRGWFRARQSIEGYLAVGAQQPYYIAYIAQNHRAALANYGALCTTLMAGWARKVGVPVPVRSLGSKCRVGIASAHIHSHSVWHAILRGWIEQLDPAQFELHVFHTGAVRDAETESAKRRVAHLHHGLGDWRAWAKAISDSHLDVLIYPEIGMDATTVRLAALRLSRVQLASWGHPITTGLPTIDGFISAEAFEPAGAEAHYTETLIPLPGLGCCYKPFGIAPARVDLSVWGIGPADRVLLCAGTPFKYAPRDDALLIDIARRCRPCKLVFFHAQHGHLASLLEQRLRAAFDAAGMRFEDSIRFVPWQAHAAFFGLLDRADVYLDSVGFSGFNTTMQAVERGTPVVAWEGEFMRGRFASGILRQAGLDEWVADSASGFVDRVERLCSDSSLRDRVRGQIAARRSKLFDDRDSVAALARRLLTLSNSS